MPMLERNEIGTAAVLEEVGAYLSDLVHILGYLEAEVQGLEDRQYLSYDQELLLDMFHFSEERRFMDLWLVTRGTRFVENQENEIAKTLTEIAIPDEEEPADSVSGEERNEPVWVSDEDDVPYEN